MKNSSYIMMIGLTAMVCLFSCGKDEPLLLKGNGVTETEGQVPVSRIMCVINNQ